MIFWMPVSVSTFVQLQCARVSVTAMRCFDGGFYGWLVELHVCGATYNYEHGILLGPGDFAQTGEDQLKARFEKARPIVYRRFPGTAGLGQG